MSHEVVKNHEIELLKESLSGGGGVVARKTVGESLGIFFSFCLIRTNDTPQALHLAVLPSCRHKVSEGLSHCGPELGIAVSNFNVTSNIVSQFQGYITFYIASLLVQQGSEFQCDQ